ncbi:MAG TPA: hypothetical protein DD414_09590 [Lachnospiraceae bacterium]|nr:hypothetical protein [Lachnospiraceae bacterium]
MQGCFFEKGMILKMRNRFCKMLTVVLIVALTGNIPGLSVLAEQADEILADNDWQDEGKLPENLKEGEELPAEPELPEDAGIMEEESSGKEDITSEDILEGQITQEEMSLMVYQDGGAEIGILGASDLSGAREALETGLRARQESIDIQAYAVDRSELSSLYSSVLNFNPDLFYVVSACGYSRNMEGTILQIRPIYDDNYTEEDIKAYQAAVEAAYKEALPVPGGMTDLQKAMALHDYLAQHMSYDFTYSRYNSYNALVERSAVCQGYTLAYAELLKKAGIPFDFCASTAMNHIWNYVQIDGKWYHVDVTWDDPTRDKAGYVSHTYFLNSDIKIEQGGHSNWTAAQTCQDTSYDNAYWQDVASAVFYMDGAEYYLKEHNRKTQLIKRQGNAEEVQQTLDAVWKVWGSGNSYWSGTYSRLSCYNGTLFFNDTTKIYQFVPGDSKLDTVYSYTGNDGYIYGALVCNGMITLGVAENPNVEAALSTVPLPDEFMPSVLSVDILTDLKSVSSGYTEAPVLTAQVSRGSGSSQEPLQYQWYKVAKDGTAAALSGANTDQYTVETGLGAGIYTYRVEVSDGNNVKSADCIVKVFPAGTAFHTITFDENNGSDATTLQVFDNDQAAAPEDPVRPGYCFKGWYLDGKPYDFDLAVTRDLTLTAKWEREDGKDPALYTVTFDSGDGGDPKTVQVTEDEKVALPEEPARTGYHFKGWYLDGKLYDFELPVTKDLMLTAQWEKAKEETPEKNDDPENDIPREDIPQGGIPEGFWIAGSQDQVYTGKAISPKVRAYDGSRTLVLGKDYTVSYKNNTKATDAAIITVKGKGNYSGTYTTAFRILKKDISEEDVTYDFTDAYAFAEGKTPKIALSVKYGGRTLKKETDYTVSYKDSRGNPTDHISAPGEYVMMIEGTGNYQGNHELAFSVVDKIPVSSLKIGKIAPVPYDGTAKTPEPVVKDGKKILVKDTDYKVSYHHNVAAGTAALVITGLGAYAGNRTIPFKITGIAIKKAQVEGLRSRPYTGTSIRQFSMHLSMKDGTELKEDMDYMVSYSNNTEAGKATVLIKGTGGYAGSLKKTFTINAVSLKKVKISPDPLAEPYAKGGAKPDVELYYGDTRLKAGRDYTLSYTGNQSAGSQAFVKITGKGNFCDVLGPIPFSVTAQKLSALKMTAADVVYKALPGNYMTSAVLYDLNGKKLSAGKDYEKELTYTYVSDTVLADGTVRKAGDPAAKSDIVPSGTSLCVETVGKGNYEGTASAVFQVTDRTIKGAKTTWNREFSYTGKAVLIEKEDFTVTVKGVVLSPDEYEILTDTYRNNTGTGTASVQIRGTKGYGGTLLLKYRIRSRKI